MLRVLRVLDRPEEFREVTRLSENDIKLHFKPKFARSAELDNLGAEQFQILLEFVIARKECTDVSPRLRKRAA